MVKPAVSRRAFLPVAGLAALLLIAAPVLGADPPGKPAKADKGPELTRTLSGTITSSEDTRGRAVFSMVVGGVTWELSAGPKWFWGAKNPLAAFVGKSVEVTGTYHAGETELNVATVNGNPLRTAGRPPWAGGPKAVGASHPGWKNGKPGNGHGRENAPGQLKDKSTANAAD
ncbi:MAG: hypothetical protein WEE50_05500 [Chloroflexota bacterium]